MHRFLQYTQQDALGLASYVLASDKTGAELNDLCEEVLAVCLTNRALAENTWRRHFPTQPGEGDVNGHKRVSIAQAPISSKRSHAIAVAWEAISRFQTMTDEEMGNVIASHAPLLKVAAE